MSTKHTPARTEDEIIEQMRIEMPYHLPDRIKPYIKEAMQIYAKEQNAELLEALEELVLVAKTFEILPSKWIDPLIKADNILNKVNN